jgi:hypothetical protein
LLCPSDVLTLADRFWDVKQRGNWSSGRGLRRTSLRASAYSLTKPVGLSIGVPVGFGQRIDNSTAAVLS